MPSCSLEGGWVGGQRQKQKPAAQGDVKQGILSVGQGEQGSWGEEQKATDQQTATPSEN